MGQIKTKWMQHDQITKNSWTETELKSEDVAPCLETKDGLKVFPGKHKLY